MGKKRGITWVIFAKLRYFISVTLSRRIASKSHGKIGLRSGVYASGKVRIDKNFLLGDYSAINVKGNLIIGENFCMNDFSRIVIHGECTIGDNVIIANQVSLLDHDHGYKIVDNELNISGYSVENVSLGNNIWIGDKAIILKGVKICDNVIIGAGSLVARSIENPGVYAGSPLRLIKKI